MMKKLLQGVLAGLVVLLVIVIVFFWTGIGTKIYYTQIDNTKVAEIAPDAGMTHSYTLVCYSEDGGEKTITFRTERVLRAEAYLKLTVAPLRGVVSWEEVTFEALPAAVQQAYAAEP